MSEDLRGTGLALGLDFGLSNLDFVLLEGTDVRASWTLPSPGRASLEVLRFALEQAGVKPGELMYIATTGGRHRELPDSVDGTPVRKIGEAEAIGQGGLALSGLEAALIVSAGTGTAMISAKGHSFQHLTGTAVGGGTLQGLSKLLIGTSDPEEIAGLAAQGDPGAVDSTLKDALGGGIGHLPESATAVNFGRVLSLSKKPERQDLAAAIVQLTAQVIGVIAVNAAHAAGFERIVVVGHLPDIKPIRDALDLVWEFYRLDPRPVIPAGAGSATALGAALSAIKNTDILS